MATTLERYPNADKGEPTEVTWWGKRKDGVIRDAGRVYPNGDSTDYWIWWLVEDDRGRFWVGLPGLPQYKRVSKKVATDPSLLDEAIKEVGA